MRYWLLLIASLILGPTTARSATPPALRQQLAAATADSTRLRLLLRLAATSQNDQPDSAAVWAAQARQLATATHNQPALLKSLGLLGILQGMRGHEEASLRLFLQQLRLTERVPALQRFQPGILSNLAHSYFSLGRFGQAQAMMRRAYRLDASAADTLGMLTDLSNMAEIQMTQGQAREALQMVQQAQALRDALRPVPPTWSLEVQQASALLRLGRLAEARAVALATLPRMQAQQLPDQLAYMYNCLLKAHRGLNELPQAEAAGQQALRYARQSGQQPLVQEVLATRADVAARRRDYPRAYLLRLQADSLSQQMTAASNAKTVQDLQVRYETERRETQIRGLAREAADQRRQNWLWAGLAVAGAGAAGLLYRSRRLQGKVFRQREQLLEERRRQSEARQLLEEAARAALQLELDSNQRELATATVFAQQKTKLLEDLTARLETLARRVPEPQRAPVAEMKRAIRQHLQVGDDWEKVTLHFEKIHPQFFEQLRQQHPALTPNDLKQCAYLKLNLTNKDIASLLNIEPNSVKISHYRIKKKLELAEESNLRDYILSI